LQKFTLLLVLIVLCFTLPVQADFELSGKIERGNNTYISNQDLAEDNIVDFYNYDNVWLKLKNKLDYPNYYYIKVKYYQKFYEDESSYDNRTLDLIGNYTQEFNEVFRNKFKLSLKDKKYINNKDSSYSSYSLSYQFRHQVNDKNQYTFDLKRKEYSYMNNKSKDYQINTYQIEWQRDVNDKFELEFGYQLTNKEHYYRTEASDKVAHKYSIDFNYDL